MPLLVALCLLAAPTGPELTVYRSLDSLPAAWRTAIPADFDFRTEQLATGATPTQRIELVVALTKAEGDDLSVWRAPRVRKCPPCSGVARAPDPTIDGVEHAPRGKPLYRMPRTTGRVFELQVAEPSPCPICRVP